MDRPIPRQHRDADEPVIPSRVTATPTDIEAAEVQEAFQHGQTITPTDVKEAAVNFRIEIPVKQVQEVGEEDWRKYQLFDLGDRKELRDDLYQLFDKFDYLGLIWGIWDRETKADRRALREVSFELFFAALLPVLASIDRVVLRALLKGTLPFDYLTNQEPRLIEYMAMASRHVLDRMPVVYVRLHLDVGGRSPTVLDLIIGVDIIIEYLDPQRPERARDRLRGDYVSYLERCVDIDTISYDRSAHDPENSRLKSRSYLGQVAADFEEAGLPQPSDDEDDEQRLQAHMTMRRARTGLRRYARTDPNAAFKKGEVNDPLRVRKMLKTARALKAALEKCPADQRNTRLAKAMAYVGWAIKFIERLKHHEKHRTNAFMGLWEATFLYMYREGLTEGFYQMRTFPIGLVAQEISAAPAEIGLSVIADCYSEDLGGFSDTGAGQSVSSTESFKKGDWAYCAFLAMKHTPLEKNLQRAVSKVKKWNEASKGLQKLEALVQRRTGNKTTIPNELELDRMRFLLIRGNVMHEMIDLARRCIEYLDFNYPSLPDASRTEENAEEEGAEEEGAEEEVAAEEVAGEEDATGAAEGDARAGTTADDDAEMAAEAGTMD